jgi:cysteine-S-conjugate beta-lyase
MMKRWLNMREQTSLVNTTRESADGFDSFSVPTHRGSTLIYPTYESFVTRGQRGRGAYTYGLHGTPTTRTLETTMSALEGGVDSFLTPSGLMAITTAIMAIVEAGDTVLFPDTVYPPVRRFAKDTLPKFGIDAKFYDPTNLREEDLDGDRIRLIWIESPGSTTMEIQDLPTISALAAKRGILVGFDNSWASPLFFKPLKQGADIVVEAITKYLSGHSDLLLGSITVKNEDIAQCIHTHVRSIGIGVSPDDCFLALRGMETAYVRLAQVEQTALALANHIDSYDNVAEVLHPALPGFGFHELWKKQFKGSSGLFSFVMDEEPERDFAERFNRLTLLKIGASWGGTRSVLAPTVLDTERTINRSYAGRKIIRFSVGLEAVDDLIADIDRLLT